MRKLECVECGKPLTYAGTGRPPERCKRCVRWREIARKHRSRKELGKVPLVDADPEIESILSRLAS